MVGDRVEEDRDLALAQALRTAGSGEEAFEELFRSYFPRLRGFFSRRGFDPEICRELSQETLLRVFRGRGSFRGGVPLASWIFEIAANIYRNEVRRVQTAKRRGQEHSLDDENQRDLLEAEAGGHGEVAGAAGVPLLRTLHREQLEILREAVGRLPARMRRVIQLQFSCDYDNREIALIMGIAESTVKVHQHAARKRLREDLQERFGSLFSGGSRHGKGGRNG